MKQEEKSALAQKAILEAAMRLFTANGYETTSMMEIAEAAGLSKGAIYHHFSSKQQVMERLIAVVTENVNTGLWELAGNADLTAAQKVASLVDMLVNTPGNYSLIGNRWVERLPFAFLQSVRNTLGQIAVALGKILRDGIEQGEYACPCPEEIAMVLCLVFDLALDPLVVELTPQLVDARLNFVAELLKRFEAPIIDDATLKKIRASYQEVTNNEQKN